MRLYGTGGVVRTMHHKINLGAQSEAECLRPESMSVEVEKKHLYWALRRAGYCGEGQAASRGSITPASCRNSQCGTGWTLIEFDSKANQTKRNQKREKLS